MAGRQKNAAGVATGSKSGLWDLAEEGETLQMKRLPVRHYFSTLNRCKQTPPLHTFSISLNSLFKYING